jgi:uncharacterized protein (TIGR03546 family)
MNFLTKLIGILNSDASTKQVTVGFCMGLFMGFSPVLSLQGLILLLLVMCLRINLGMFMLTWSVVALLSVLLRPLTLGLGEGLLNHAELIPLWQAIYSSNLVQLTFFNHTRVMGETATALALLPIATPLFYIGIKKYREHIMEWLQKQPIVKFLKSLNIFQAITSKGGLS